MPESDDASSAEEKQPEPADAALPAETVVPVEEEAVRTVSLEDPA